MLLAGLEDPLFLLFFIPAALLAITIHEYAHGRMALAMGDPTAAMQGRLTLNPLAHLDPLGTIMILLAGFGWARPVPINPYRFNNYRQGLLKVSLAGPVANFILAFLGVFLLKLIGFHPFLIQFFSAVVSLNIALGIFNLLPVPPLDGSKVLSSLLPSHLLGPYRQIEPYAPLVLIFLLATGVLTSIIYPLIFLVHSFLETIVNIIIVF